MLANVIKVFLLNIAHQIPTLGPGCPCARLHGHNLKVTVTVRGIVNPLTGVVLDFYQINDAWAPIHEALDHRYLNDVEGLAIPSMEQIASWIWFRLLAPLCSTDRAYALYSVAVWEGDTDGCEFKGDL